MAEYVSAIPDGVIRHFMSDLATKKIAETHLFLEWISKAMHQLALNCPKFIDRLSAHLRTTNKMVETMKEGFILSTQNEMTKFKNYISENGFAAGFKATFEDEIKFRGSFSSAKSVAQMLEEVRDLADYKHHMIMQKLVVKKFQPAPVIQDLSKLVQIVAFDKIHSEGINCVDMDPYGKILVSGSNDGYLKFVDLETMSPIEELVHKPYPNTQIKAVCIDDKHNVAYVDSSNKLSIFSIEQGKVIAEYQGGFLSELVDIIPAQACQFTSDYNYLAFRSESGKIVLFDMLTKSIVKEYNSSEKINDFSISPQRDYMAFAIYSECMTEIHDIKDGSKISELDLDRKEAGFTLSNSSANIHCPVGQKRNPLSVRRQLWLRHSL